MFRISSSKSFAIVRIAVATGVLVAALVATGFAAAPDLPIIPELQGSQPSSPSKRDSLGNRPSPAKHVSPTLPESPGYRVIKKFAPGGDGGWDYLTLDPSSRRLYIARSDRVMLFDVDRAKSIGEFPDTPGVHGVAIISKLGRGFTSNGRDSTVSVFDLKTLKEIGRIRVGQSPDGILYDSASARLFTFNASSADATAVDPATQKVIGTIPLGGKPESSAADGKGHVFVNLEDRDELLDLDARKLSVVHRWPVAPGKQPVGLAMDVDRRRLFCTCRNGKMVVLSADDGRVLATLPIGQRTDACAFDSTLRLAFSSNGDGTLTIVRAGDREHYSVVQTVITQMGARTMALDPMTHNLFLVTAIPKTGEKRSYEPGTFVIIVVAKPDKTLKQPGLLPPRLLPPGSPPSRLLPPNVPRPRPGVPPGHPPLPGSPPGQPLPPAVPPAQPIPGQPGPSQPIPGQPGPGQPSPSQSGPSQPIPGQPGPGQPNPPNSTSNQIKPQPQD